MKFSREIFFTIMDGFKNNYNGHIKRFEKQLDKYNDDDVIYDKIIIKCKDAFKTISLYNHLKIEFEFDREVTVDIYQSKCLGKSYAFIQVDFFRKLKKGDA